MNITPSIPISASTLSRVESVSANQTQESVQVFIAGGSYSLSLGDNKNRQQLKAILGQHSLAPLTENRMPHFNPATGEQKASVKAYLSTWFHPSEK